MRADGREGDWGTTNLGAFAVGRDGVLDQAVSDDGMGRLDRDGFEPALLRLVAAACITSSRRQRNHARASCVQHTLAVLARRRVPAAIQ